MAGHGADEDDVGAKILIDAHDREVCEEVWDLYDLALESGNAAPTLIEWDNDIPSWQILFAQAQAAERRLQARLERADETVPTNSPEGFHGE